MSYETVVLEMDIWDSKYFWGNKLGVFNRYLKWLARRLKSTANGCPYYFYAGDRRWHFISLLNADGLSALQIPYVKKRDVWVLAKTARWELKKARRKGKEDEEDYEAEKL